MLTVTYVLMQDLNKVVSQQDWSGWQDSNLILT